jgi:hypothetical protein
LANFEKHREKILNNFSIEAFVTGCNAAMTGGQNRERAAQQLFDTYCTYIQKQTRSNHHG